MRSQIDSAVLEARLLWDRDLALPASLEAHMDSLGIDIQALKDKYQN